MTVEHHWDMSVDLLVIGAGAAGMTAALVASLQGLDVLLCEKSSMVGGTTSTSAGTVWIPGTRHSAWAGVPDTVDAARDYLNSVIQGTSGAELREAFLQSGAEVVDYLEENTDVVLPPQRPTPIISAIIRARHMAGGPSACCRLTADCLARISSACGRLDLNSSLLAA